MGPLSHRLYRKHRPVSVSLNPRFHALVPCAGKGLRAATLQPKQYTSVAGKPMVEHTLVALSQVPRLSQVWVVVHPEDTSFATHVSSFQGQVLPVGGATRAHSVLNGLIAMQAQGVAATDWVLVHDAARCLLKPAWVNTLIDCCQADAVGGLLAWPVADSLKTGCEGRVVGSVDRSDKWLAQTPQMFRWGLLQAALTHSLARSPEGLTDEAGAIEAMGAAPRLVLGAFENFKLTYPSDFEVAERILRSRS